MRPYRIFSIIGLFLLTSVLIMVTSCSEDKEVTFEPAPFTLNEDLLGPAVEIPSVGLALRQPAGWHRLDSLQLDQFRRMLSGTDLIREFDPVYPLVVFIDSTTGCMAYVAQIQEVETPLPVMAELYNDFLEPRASSAALSRAEYTINGMETFYFLLHSSQVVNYKLIGQAAPGKRFLIEFVVGGAIYGQLEPTVSSSLASLRPLTSAPPDSAQ